MIGVMTHTSFLRAIARNIPQPIITDITPPVIEPVVNFPASRPVFRDDAARAVIHVGSVYAPSVLPELSLLKGLFESRP